ncbi:MAG: type II toxin-antitoxin system VapC family toxin [Planctomycetaceae bacterium]
MTVSDADTLILDTSIVVDVAKNNRSGQAILDAYPLTSRSDRPLISVITMGEILGIAKIQTWTSAKIDSLHELLSEFVKLDLTTDVVEAYAELVSLCRTRNHTMGQQNDMWIAATAKVAGAVLLTGDSGFKWLNSLFIRVEYVPRGK